MNPPTKILLALQFWEGDREAAMRLARLVADIEPAKSDRADFLFISRFDCTHDAETVKYVARKFNVYTHINRTRREVGWPAGPNGLWFGTMDHCYDYGRSKKLPTYKAILTFEADGFPLRPDWIARLSEEWDKSRGAKVVGAYQTSPGPHINGNALFSGDPQFLYEIARKISGCRPSGGWDYELAPTFKRLGWRDCAKMRSWWQMKTLPEETYLSLINQDVVFLHGVKDDSVIRHVRKKYLNQ